jgi:hypothetical protein
MTQLRLDKVPLARIVPAGEPTATPEPDRYYEAGGGRCGDGRLLICIACPAGEHPYALFDDVTNNCVIVLTSAQLETEPLRPVEFVPVDKA